MKKDIRQVINSYLQTKVTLRESSMTQDNLDKKLFIDSLNLLREIDDRRDFMEEELGVDLSVYEEKFLQVIENLFRMHFSKEQLSLIQHYVYVIPTLQNWDGKVDVTDGKEIITVDFETPEQVWNVITSIKKKSSKSG
ncbi:MAG TPA: hypothetical protein PKC87_00130 [Candidatus Absconditabacterales bacterium]|nr:hypothetical protein [Candidatus Absconditabacterales bacterium]